MKKIILVSALVLMSSRAMAVVDHPGAWLFMSTGMSSYILVSPIVLPVEGSAYVIGYSMDGEQGALKAREEVWEYGIGGSLIASQFPLVPFYLSSGADPNAVIDMYSSRHLSYRKEALEEIDDPKLEPQEPVEIEEPKEEGASEENPEVEKSL